MFKFLKDISHLYESRDHLWKEIFKIQATSKRRHKELLARIHYLECKVKKDEFSGRQSKTFEAVEAEEKSQS